MAKRPRSHQLEDESITAFRAARPSRWPVRKKDDDYGIDFEVEIFDETDSSTGLMFLAQLKATDAETDRKLTLDREYLGGICQYDSPTIIVRYFARDRRLYWAWAADLLAQIPDGQASKLFHFEDEQILDADAFIDIYNALKVARYIESVPATASLPIRLDLDEVQGRRKLQLRRSLERIQAADHPAISFFEADEPRLGEGIVLEVAPQAIRISFGPRYTGLFYIDGDMAPEKVAGRVLYAICSMLDVSGLPIHAARQAKNLLELAVQTDVRLHAAQAARCLVNDPEAYVDIAILNELHALQDIHYLSVLFGIYEKPGRREGVSAQGIRFLEAALARAVDDGPSAEGVILYSMANAARQIDIKFAFSLYLRAKRKKPEYLNTDYYLREVAGCLFLLGRFGRSRELYEKAGLSLDSELDCLLLADASLFSGEIGRAVELYQRLSLADDAVIHSEAGLKLWLAAWLQESGETGFTARLTKRFNEGVALARSGEHEQALSKFLVCCLIVPNDHESWINSAICCHNMPDPTLYAQLLVVGFSLLGEPLLDSLMRVFDERGADDRMYDLLSEAYAVVRSSEPQAKLHQSRIKVDHNFDVTVPIEGDLDLPA